MISNLHIYGQDSKSGSDNKLYPLILDSVTSNVSGSKLPISLHKNRLFSFDDSIKSKTDNFYDSLRFKAEKRKLTREIIDLIIIAPSDTNVKNASESETPFIEYNNKIIRDISFKQLSVFGPTIEDTTIQALHFYQKAGNKMHMNTSNNILKKNLLIKTGDRLDANTMADNERIIRSLPFIHDVRFIVRQTNPLSDSVDIIVMTKDLWSLGFGLEMSGVNKGKIGIWYKNLFGFGNEERNTIFWDSDEKHLLGYEGIYRINNLAGSFINSEFRFTGNHGTQIYYANFLRNFFTPQIKYAGGFRVENKKTIEDIELLDTILFKTNYNYTGYDFWIGRAFPLKAGSLLSHKRSNLMFAGKVHSMYYHERPVVEPDYLFSFHNRLQFLATAAISNQGFYKSHLIYGFGPTEDIPYGYLIQLIGGYEIDEFKNRPYIGFAISHGAYLWSRGGYLYSKLEAGGYYTNKSYEQGLINFSTKYFTPLFSLNRFKFRYFVNFDYKNGIRRYSDEYISIENNEGLTGLTSDNLKGIQKMMLNIEAVSFTPYYFLGFRFVMFGFADLGIIGSENKMIFNNSLFSGLGLGVRLRNEKLIFNTFQIKFAFYPVVPENAKVQNIQISGEQKLRMDNFYISDPKTIEF